MRHIRHQTLAAAAATAAVLLALTACGSDNTREAKKPTPAASSATPDAVVVVPEDPTTEPFDGSDDELPTWSYDGMYRSPLERLAIESDTNGTNAEIALRFLRALQDRDHLAAARTLNPAWRVSLSFGTPADLRRVMSDVTKNAGLKNAPKCHSARELNADAAVVHCGAKRVVVHLSHAPFDGVALAPWHVPGDVYRRPHTHAYTDIDF